MLLTKLQNTEIDVNKFYLKKTIIGNSFFTYMHVITYFFYI